MKQTENNEMDLLLRSLAKRASSISETVNEAQLDDAHLDADELNAFAERSVPPAARARYTAHIADCSRCRKLAASLTAAAGLPIGEIKTEERAQMSLWQRLPAFLSPAVLRFAVPALALLAVVTVGLITFRQQQSTDYVAQNRETTTPQPELKSSPESTSPGTEGQIKTHSSSAPAQNPAPAAETPAKPGEKVQAVDEITSVDSSSGYLAKDAPKADSQKTAEPTFAPEPAAAPPAKPLPTPSREADKNEAVAKQNEEAAGDKATREARDERQAVEDRETLSRSRKAASAGRGGALSSVEARRGESKQKRADQDAEIREVAGRRFQRQGTTWIDVDYDPGRSVMTVVRGSEQYRVLVADEPAIRTIAERLAGEVIVVWKGRAYRIR
ncbi:MAG: hypothetical protein ACR2H6_00530 [Pyrinomonadaceae bacterium]